MKKSIGFIGCGKMASAIIGGISKDDKYIVRGSEVTADIAQSAAGRLGIEVFSDNKRLVSESDVIFIATKPNQVETVLTDIVSMVKGTGKLIVSIAAGVTTGKIENILADTRVVRVMPNTPALVKLGMFGVCCGTYATSDDENFVVEMLSSIGRCITVEENQMDLVTAISGSGPAFFYQVIEDMARAGERLGLEYDKALTLATQTALGSAQMVFERGNVPVQTLIDNVATKGGCTFVGISEMKDKNSTRMFYDVIEKTAIKANELGRG